VNTVTEYAGQVMSRIRQDQQRPMPSGTQIPPDASGFSALREHCDPIQRYIVAVLGDAAGEGPGGGSCALAGAVIAEVDERLCREAEALWGDRPECNCRRNRSLRNGHDSTCASLAGQEEAG
jgi:hypothetical protein